MNGSYSQTVYIYDENDTLLGQFTYSSPTTINIENVNYIKVNCSGQIKFIYIFKS